VLPDDPSGSAGAKPVLGALPVAFQRHVTNLVDLPQWRLAVLAFGLRTLMPFTSLPAKYVAYAKWVWRRNPEYMTQGLGLAKFFGPDRIALQHSLLIWTALLLPSLAAVLAWQVGRRRPGGLPNMDLALTTLALTCFHALIVVPYQYLYFTPVFFALASAAIVQSGRNPAK
jgi:hypothetical protein